MLTVLLSGVLAAATTTTNPDDVPRVVGDPLPLWEWLGSGLLLLAVILAAGWYVSRRTRDSR
jgi:hypothetical protein